MVRSDPTAVALLRNQLIAEARGRCEWEPHCPRRATDMAHIFGKRMGGSAAEDTLDRVAFLCRWHHDVLDGRTTNPDLVWPELAKLGVTYRPGQPGLRSELRHALHRRVNATRGRPLFAVPSSAPDTSTPPRAPSQDVVSNEEKENGRRKEDRM